MVCVQSAWIWKDPDASRSDPLFLPADPCMSTIESSSIRSDPDNREPRRLELSHLALERDSARSIFLVAELGRSCCSAAHNRGYSVTASEKLVTLTRMQQTLGEPGCMECGPEAIAWFCKMKPRRSGIESRIDAAE